MIRLARSVVLTKQKKHINTVCLPVKESQQIDSPLVEDKTLTIAGWGHTENNTVSTNDVLIYAHVPYLPHELCVARFAKEMKTHLELRVDIQETQMCAGGVDKVDS